MTGLLWNVLYLPVMGIARFHESSMCAINYQLLPITYQAHFNFDFDFW
jgi:hypothetical protein